MVIMDKLLETLESINSDELDKLLDQRDEDPFDSAWINLNQKVSKINVSIDNKDLFIKLSSATNHHEVCSYIADDLELINKAETLGIESEFLGYLKQCYEQGEVPN
ncbi:hypothetical protein Swoo_3494 [Shewanella woodyi ATCC 51908]|uniref:Uncharacterized protein n=2 Tax=Shewanella woodyi TaxID=60961 RepID=B1KRJ4_SHEWM|nr:hypothetical protein Swoo_3494 [Shewanella woodyi ATCC 51908]